MFFDVPHNDPGLAAQLALLMSMMRAPNPQQEISQIVSGSEIGAAQSAYFPGDAFCPKVFAQGSADFGLVLLYGTESLAQAQGLWEGYVGGSAEPPSLPTNDYLYNARDTAYTTAFSGGVTGSAKILVAGWSLGGAVGCILATAWTQGNSRRDTRIVTLGAPRPGNRSLAAALSNARIARWFHEADPIPLLPPRFADFPAGLVLLGLQAIRRCENFAHPAGGIQLRASGLMETGELPETAVPTWTTSISTWALGLDGDPYGPHGLTSYSTLLTLAKQLMGGENLPLAAGAPAETVRPHKAGDRSPAQQAFVQTLSENSAQQNMVTPRQPSQHMSSVVRLSEGWAVALGSSMIGLTPHKKTALALSRELNGFLGSLQKLGFVDPQAILEQVQQFLQLAQAEGNGFDPPLRVTF